MNIRNNNKIINANEYELYDIIKTNYNFNINDCTISKISTNYFRDLYTLTKEDNFFDFSFSIKYQNKCKYCYKICYKNIIFYILMNTSITAKIKQHLNYCIYRVYLVKNLYNIKPNENMNYYILLNPLKRKLPSKKNEIMMAKNINGGFTFINSNNIYIIRKEDYEKVIIHELLHHNNNIHFDNWKDSNIKILKKICKIAEDEIFIPNEAIIETFAIILNVIFTSIERNLPFRKLLKEDKAHNIIIAKKIIGFQDNKLWKENTHSYCYIVLRAVLYVYFKNFIIDYDNTDDDKITQFICKYFPKIIKKIKRQTYIVKDNFIKQTIFYNF